MSRCEERLEAAVAALREADGASPEVLRAIISAATRLYAASCEAAGRELAPLAADIPATEAMVLACALVRSQNLNSFDFAMWFSGRG